MKIPSHGDQVTRRGITLTVDFVANDQVFYRKHREKPAGEPDSLESDWNRFMGLFRAPLDVWNAQATAPSYEPQR